MKYVAILPSLCLSFSLVACSSSSDNDQPVVPESDAATDSVAADSDVAGDSTPDISLPSLPSAETTLSATLVPAHAIEAHTNPNPALPANLPPYVDGGYGVLNPGPAEPYITLTLDKSAPPNPGPNAKRVLRFAHLTDLQLGDDESPDRMGGVDSFGSTFPALRPQDADICRMVNSAVRTINGLHRVDPLAFVLMGGDTVDSAQSNELQWALGVLNGGAAVECDSGNDDDIIPGPFNDGKDPFMPEGLLMPWKWVTGNHDVLVQGNFNITGYASKAIGDQAASGTRDYTKGGALVTGTIVPDPRRALMDRATLMKTVAGDADGHGLGADQINSGRAFYTFDPAGSPIRFVILDTAAEKGGAEGLLHQADVDSFVKPALDAAKQEGKWVILASHHAFKSLTTNGGTFGTTPADPVTPAAWMQLIGSYDNILFSLVGHTHEHEVNVIQPDNGHAIWEIMSSAIADFPHQFRTIEIFDQDNGWVMLRATCVNLDVSNDPVGDYGRQLGTIDLTSGWMPTDGRGAGPEVRNVELWTKKP
jgi:3',5'-cyclic AMP phosphodiesterase CpdA